MKKVLAMIVAGLVGTAAHASWIVIYEDDFAGDAGPGTDTKPLVEPDGFEHQIGAGNVYIDGSGRLHTGDGGVTSRYDVNLGEVITDNWTAIRWEATIGTPSENHWFGLGFSETGTRSFTTSVGGVNPGVGPWIQFRADGEGTMRGGAGTNNASSQVDFNYEGGDVVDIVFTFNIAEQTGTLSVNGTAIVFDNDSTVFPIVYTNNDGTSLPVIQWASIQWTSQDSIEEGGAYISHSTISVIPEPGTLGLLGMALIGLMAVRRRYRSTL